MAQSYYQVAEYNQFHRPPPHRPASTAGSYDRHMPYGYYEHPRQEYRQEYGGRPITRAMIHEPEPETGPASSRRRIAVACTRCRRRKIKCSGDPGDGTGCQACRASGADVNLCNFIRVGSQNCQVVNVEPYTQATSAGSAPQTATYASDSSSRDPWTNMGYQIHSRPSLPTLHTRSSFADNSYDQYESSPVDAYTYASTTIPRQDSFTSTYGGLENYRSWGTSGSMCVPASASFYDHHPGYSFGALQAPSYPQPSNITRLPSVTAESFSSLNMGSLHSSLPTQTVQERRLPAPYTVHYPPTPYSTTELPGIRPLQPFNEPRVHINGIHSRTALPWSQDIAAPSLRTAAVNNSAQAAHRAPDHPHQTAYASRIATTASVSEPVLGYQFNSADSLPTTSGSPNISPTSGPSVSDAFPITASSSFSTTSMPPPAGNLRYSSAASQALPAITTSYGYSPRPRVSSSGPREAATASLYSYSTERSDPADRPATSESDDQGSSADSSSSGSATVSGTGQPGYTTYRQYQRQPQLTNGDQVPTRQNSFDRSRPQAVEHRMSVSHLNGRY